MPIRPSISVNIGNMDVDLDALIDDSAKGLLRSIGDAGAVPTNTTGSTLLKLVSANTSKISEMLNHLKGILPGVYTRIDKHGSIIVGPEIIHTVTAGKVFYLTRFGLSVYTSTVADGDSATLSVRNGSDVFQYTISKVHLHSGGPGSSDISVGLPNPIPIPANYDVYISSNASPVAAIAQIGGWEE